MDSAENKALFNITEELIDPIKVAIRKFESHPSVDIKVKVKMEIKFSKVSICDIELEVKSLETKKSSILLNIPTKQLKTIVADIIVEPYI